MSWSLTASSSVGGTGSTNPVTISGLNTGASNVFYAYLSYYNADPSAVDIADSKGNTYILIATQASAADSNLHIGIFRCLGPTNDSNLSITYTPPVGAVGQFPSMIFDAFTQGSTPSASGSPVGTGTNSSGSVQPGSIGVANDLVVEALAFYGAGLSGNTIDSSFSTVVEVAYSAGQHIGLSRAWKEILAATNPIWTTNIANVVAALAAAVTGTGSGGTTVKQLAALGVG